MINIHTREITSELTSLVKQIDVLLADGSTQAEGKSAFVVLLTDDPDEAEAQLAEIAKAEEIQHTPLTYFDGVAGPRGYNIARDAEVTIMMWKNGVVEVNQSFGVGELTADMVEEVVANAIEFLQ